MKIVSVIGSNHRPSDSHLIMKKLIPLVIGDGKKYEGEIVFLGDFYLEYCKGCQKCFREGHCPLDKKDDFTSICKRMEIADIIFFCSPVYVHSVPGIMKTFIDRMARSCHLMDFAGKLGFTLTTTFGNGQEIVQDYLVKIQVALGIKNVGNYEFITGDRTRSKEDFTQATAKKMLKELALNFGYGNVILDENFLNIKSMYTNISENSPEFSMVNAYEWKYWNQLWVKESRSFHEYAIKIRERGNKYR